MDIYIDADGCPVKDETYRASAKYRLRVFVVSNSFMHVPAEKRIERVIVGKGPDAADDWIAEHVGEGDIVITTDIPLADRCIKKGARVIDARGNEFTEDSIGNQLATRDLMEQLRMMGAVSGGPSPVEKKHRSLFLARLHEVIQSVLRAQSAD